MQWLTTFQHEHTGQAAIENVNTIDERRSKLVRNRVFDCHLSPVWRQMAIKSTVSSDFLIRVRRLIKRVFDCSLPGVMKVESVVIFSTLVVARFMAECVLISC